ncbi:PAS domain S-box-containing protein [Flavimobilis soli]|uniref:PAS domain S-box-containing protein n=1 Tax=Flavimobilis soli TaxID=442709 RepID=A0A2A9EEJ4_9MICO|nr:PAS domain-containing protein [Flavimobilis soli]PFG37223.1 PAS domain S-box-containing protein [Flavimobilis soli]
MPALTDVQTRPHPTEAATERRLAPDDLVVTKTDLRGHITYANETFLRVSGASETEVAGRAHNLIRHPDMPGGVFRLMWDTLGAGEEIFAYVLNRAIDGPFYWVLAHVTPTRDRSGAVVAYHSTRRAPSRDAIPPVRDLYARMRELERGRPRREGAEASLAWLTEHLDSQGLSYEEWLWSLEGDL